MVRTLAGAKPGKVELNVISYGGSVNISTGEVNTTINGIIYTDKHLAIYKVEKVLLPMDFFTVAKAPVKAPSLAPEPSADTEINTQVQTHRRLQISRFIICYGQICRKTGTQLHVSTVDGPVLRREMNTDD
ncbi:Fasciclin-like arabinogalactan protein 11 [Sesbania bispinosa]|nr:Fasciclin-like arabinogalactan protein 11 [Sesbania bispinosa]